MQMENVVSGLQPGRRQLSDIAFILLNLRKHPIELARSDFSAAEFADAGRIYL